MIVGDALIGKPPCSVTMLATEKYADVEKAREGLRRLLKYNFDTLLVGDGTSIMAGAKQAVERAIGCSKGPPASFSVVRTPQRFSYVQLAG